MRSILTPGEKNKNKSRENQKSEAQTFSGTPQKPLDAP
jgi:hypothetical protein